MMPFLVGRLEPFGDLTAGLECLLNGEGPSIQPRLERFPLRKLEDEEAPSLGFLKTVDRGDIGMVQDGQELGLPLEPGHSLLVLGKGSRKDLDGDVATEVLVNGPIDLAHPACADVFENFIAASENGPRMIVRTGDSRVLVREGETALGEVSEVAQLPQNRDVSGLSV